MKANDSVGGIEDVPRIPLPASVRQALQVRLGSDAEEWLGRRLPEIARWCRSNWALKITDVLEGGATAVVLGTEGPDGASVLKIHPHATPYRRELRGWRLWSGRGMPTLLGSDDSRHVLFQERVRPATELAAVADREAACDHAIALHRKLRATDATTEVPPLSALVAGRFTRAEALVHRGAGVPSALLEQARETARLLLTTTAEDSVLHGDFFPDNIVLSGPTGWLAIDPQPCVGDAAFDAGTWSYAYGRGEHLDQNAEQFADGSEQQADRTRRWAFVVAVTNLAGRIAYGHADEREISTTLAACQRFGDTHVS